MTKRTAKKTKEIARKKKKKEPEQSMDETISFVIKGKLTPLKPAEKAKLRRPRKKVPPKLPEHKIKVPRKSQQKSDGQKEPPSPSTTTTKSAKQSPKSDAKDQQNVRTQSLRSKAQKPADVAKPSPVPKKQKEQKKEKEKEQKKELRKDDEKEDREDEQAPKAETSESSEKKKKPPIKKDSKKTATSPKTVGTKPSTSSAPGKKTSKPEQKPAEDPKPKVATKRKRTIKESSTTTKESPSTSNKEPPVVAKESPPPAKESPPPIKEPPAVIKDPPTTSTVKELPKDVEETPKIKTEPVEETPLEGKSDKPKTIEEPSVVETPSPIKEEPKSDEDKTSDSGTSGDQKSTSKSKLAKKKVTIKDNKAKIKRKADQRRKMKLFSLWTGPKRHRVASLNALAKVHCLYENESRANIIDNIQPIKREPADKKEKAAKAKAKEKAAKAKEDDPPPTRTLRTAPGMRGVGRHWDMHDTMSSSSSEDTCYESSTESVVEKPKNDPPSKPEEKKPPVKRRKRNEVVMDLKDMVVRKRMASLNASAILAASYSLEKNSSRSPRNSSDSDTESDSCSDDFDRRTEDDGGGKKDDKLIEVRATPNKKVAVIVNQDTDVTITGVYVNSTTRSTHHEGYCSIAGMQYRISATSHTQTAATAVATETLLQSASSSSQENSNGESTPSKSYTPLDALSNMQPPSGASAQHSVPMGHHHLGPPHISPQLSPLPRRHGCSSAFSAPPGHYPAGHHHPPTQIHPDQGYMHGYYQPAGPLINVPHHTHTQQQSSLGKTAPLSEPSPSVTPPPTQPPPASSSTGDSSDNDVIITSVMTKDSSPPQQPTYRLGQYPPPPTHSYPYAYPYYHAPPPPHPATYTHHDLCYPSSATYLHKYPYRRYMAPPTTSPYFPANPPDLYGTPPPTQQAVSSQSSQQRPLLLHQHLSCNLCPQVVTASQSAAVAAPGGSGGGSAVYQPPLSGPPPAPPTMLETYPPPPAQPPPTLVETYPPPPPHYYPGYAPPPPCYTHSPARSLPYGAYQSCPCPMNTCPKNVHTGPLIGSNKRSDITSLTKDKVLLPVALALPLEPASATGPPSPARGSAGMPAPTSPAVAGTYQAPPTPKQETPEPEGKGGMEKRRPARVGKSFVRNNLHQSNTMLLMCQERDQNHFLDEVKREVESPKEEQKKVLLDPEIEREKEVIVSKVEALQSAEEEIADECPGKEIKTDDCNHDPDEEVVPQDSQEHDDEEDETSTVKETPPLVPDILEPCVKTVAENVKVKNMKRRSSSVKVDEAPPSPPKKRKIDPKVNGSYKDLIKKSCATVQINNGKRKLLSANQEPTSTPLTRTKRLEPKRTRSTSKEIEARKQIKLAKQASNEDVELIENTEPTTNQLKRKKLCARNTKNLKITTNADKGFQKSNVDRTIDSVVSEGRTKVLSDAQRTNGEKVTNNKANKCEIKKETVLRKKIVKLVPKPAETKKGVTAKKKLKQKPPEVVVAAPIVKPRRSFPVPKWSNGWTWMGEPYEGKVFLNSDEANVARKCYPAMRHEEGDVIEPRDCVLLKAGQKKNDLPFVAKVAALWENPEDGEMMFSLLWYYRPEHTEQGRLLLDEVDEVFASRHKDSNSVACIEDKCYVLTFNEYCRYRKNLRRLEHGLEEIPSTIPANEPYPRTIRQPPANVVTAPDLVFFCRRVYDFRQKRIVKNPS